MQLDQTAGLVILEDHVAFFYKSLIMEIVPDKLGGLPE